MQSVALGLPVRLSHRRSRRAWTTPWPTMDVVDADVQVVPEDGQARLTLAGALGARHVGRRAAATRAALPGAPLPGCDQDVQA